MPKRLRKTKRNKRGGVLPITFNETELGQLDRDIPVSSVISNLSLPQEVSANQIQTVEIAPVRVTNARKSLRRYQYPATRKIGAPPRVSYNLRNRKGSVEPVEAPRRYSILDGDQIPGNFLTLRHTIQNLSNNEQSTVLNRFFQARRK
jgi:hypothetical protein